MDKNQTPLGRFSEPALLILSCLQSSPKYGQAIREEIEQIHGLWLEPGTLWGALSRLEYWGWIEPLETQGRGCSYRVTAVGTGVLHHASTFLLERIAISDLDKQQGQQTPARSPTFLRKSSVTLGRGLLRLYPRPWRRRYAAEMVSLLEQQPITFLTLLDLLCGALDAQFHPLMSTEHVSLARRRSAAISFICVFPLFLLAFFALALQPVASPFSDPPGILGIIVHVSTYNNSVVHISSTLIGLSALVVFLALLVSGLLLAGTHMRSALVARRPWALPLASLPGLIELLALVALISLVLSLQDDWPFHLALLILGAVTSLVLAFVEAFRKEMTRRIVTVALIPATVGTFAMAGAWVAYVIWGMTTWAAVPEWYRLSSPFEDWLKAWGMSLFLLALPTAFALWRWFLALFATGKATKAETRISFPQSLRQS